MAKGRHLASLLLAMLAFPFILQTSQATEATAKMSCGACQQAVANWRKYGLNVEDQQSSVSATFVEDDPGTSYWNPLVLRPQEANSEWAKARSHHGLPLAGISPMPLCGNHVKSTQRRECFNYFREVEARDLVKFWKLVTNGCNVGTFRKSDHHGQRCTDKEVCGCMGFCSFQNCNRPLESPPLTYLKRKSQGAVECTAGSCELCMSTVLKVGGRDMTANFPFKHVKGLREVISCKNGGAYLMAPKRTGQVLSSDFLKLSKEEAKFAQEMVGMIDSDCKWWNEAYVSGLDGRSISHEGKCPDTPGGGYRGSCFVPGDREAVCSRVLSCCRMDKHTDEFGDEVQIEKEANEHNLLVKTRNDLVKHWEGKSVGTVPDSLKEKAKTSVIKTFNLPSKPSKAVSDVVNTIVNDWVKGVGDECTFSEIGAHNRTVVQRWFERMLSPRHPDDLWKMIMETREEFHSTPWEGFVMSSHVNRVVERAEGNSTMLLELMQEHISDHSCLTWGYVMSLPIIRLQILFSELVYRGVYATWADIVTWSTEKDGSSSASSSPSSSSSESSGGGEVPHAIGGSAASDSGSDGSDSGDFSNASSSSDSSTSSGDDDEDPNHIKEFERNLLFRARRLPLQEPPPKTFDIRDKWGDCAGLSPSDQGNCGTCWAMSTSHMLSTRICIASNGTVDTLVSPADIAMNTRPSMSFRRGSEGADPFVLAGSLGILQWTKVRSANCARYRCEVPNVRDLTQLFVDVNAKKRVLNALAGGVVSKVEKRFFAKKSITARMAAAKWRDRVNRYSRYAKNEPSPVLVAEYNDKCDKPCMFGVKNGTVVAGFVNFPNTTSQAEKENVIKHELMAHGPMVVALQTACLEDQTYGKFGKPRPFLNPESPECKHPNHAVVLIGWTETHWIIQNSWGNFGGFDDQGFYRINKQAMKAGAWRHVWAAADVLVPEKGCQ